MPPPLRATRGVAFYLVASAFTCRACSAYSCNSLCSVMGGGQSTAHSSTICLYYTTINFFCQVFYTTFLELFLFFVLRFQRAPCAALRFPFTLQGRWLGFAVPILALSKKEIPLLSFRPITPHIRDILFSLLRRFARFRICIIFGNLLYRFW